MSDKRAAITKILNRIVESVHNLDYEAVRDLIPDDGVYFGSVAVKAQGYDELYEKQFSRVWPNIDEFKIDPSSVSIHTSDNIAWATCLFESSVLGTDYDTAEEFQPERRQIPPHQGCDRTSFMPRPAHGEVGGRRRGRGHSQAVIKAAIDRRRGTDRSGISPVALTQRCMASVVSAGYVKRGLRYGNTPAK